MTARPGQGRRRALFTASAALLAALCLLQALALWSAPPAWFPAAIALTLAPGQTAVLGRDELAAPQADRGHLAIRRDADGNWWLRNLSPGKHLLLQNGAHEQDIGSVALAPAQTFRLSGERFDVTRADNDSLAFTQAGHHWRYDGAQLVRDGQVQAPCPGSKLGVRALALWNRIAPRSLQQSHALVFGGNLYCGSRLGLAGVPAGAATLTRHEDQWRLAAGADPSYPLMLATGAADSDVRHREVALAGVQALIVGHTRLALQPEGQRLTLVPSRRISYFSAPAPSTVAGLNWSWQRRAVWLSGADTPLAMALVVLVVLLIASLAWPRRPGWCAAAAVAAAAAAVLLIGCGSAAVLLQRAGHPPSAALSLLLSGAALLTWLLLPGRLTLATAAALTLLALGLLVQLELGLGGMESSWLSYYQKSAAVLALGTGLGALWRLWSRPGRPVVRQLLAEWLLAGFAVFALAALLAEVLWGDETGVFDLQPVELGKMALTVLTAHCLALRLAWQRPCPGGRTQPARWLQLIGPALLFMTLMGMALVQVDDFSPLILMLVWSCIMLLAYALAVRHTALLLAVLALVLAAVGAIVALRLAGSGDPATWPLGGSFYADRFMVWLDPVRHPHTGQQLLQGARAIGAGGWWGSDGRLGLATLGQPAGAVLRIPAVQDDFAPAFFLNRHGLAAALLLWALQATFLVGLGKTILATYAAAGAARDFRHAWLARFRYFALCGGAAFVLGHLLLSWGTNLAIFPIMGQPMSFLSAGGSHLLFFLCPLLAMGAISALSLEENVSCRSMSSTRS